MLNIAKAYLSINKRLFAFCCLLLVSYSGQAIAQQPAQRIIVLAPHVVEMLYAIGAGEQIIGTTEHADYPEEAKQIQRVGNYATLSVELILSLQPDLVIGWKTGNPPEDLAKLESLGLNMAYSDPIELDDVATEILYFGQLTGHQQAANTIAKQYRAELSQLKTQYQNQKPITTFYELWPNPLTTISNHAWPQQAIEVCGIKNIFTELKGDYPQVNLEQVIILQPESLIIPVSATQERKSDINWQSLKHIPAIKKQQIAYPNADILHRMTTRIPSELAKLCAQFAQFR